MDLYSENILYHYKNPSHTGHLEHVTNTFTEYNSQCGDKITVELLVEDETIKDIAFIGSGCAISQASMSMLTDEVLGKNISEVTALDKAYIDDLLHVPISPGRVKCSLLGLAAVKNALAN